MKLGYARVSAIDSDASLQVAVLENAGCEKVVIERALGGRWDNPNLRKVLETLKTDDVFIVSSIESLGRSLVDVLAAIQKFIDKRVRFVSIADQLDTETPEGQKIASILSTFTQLHRQAISMTTREGMEDARKSGHTIGRPPKLDSIEVRRIGMLLQGGLMKNVDIARMYKVDPAVITRIKKQQQQRPTAAPA